MENQQLRRHLNLWGLTMIAVGSSIGSGIFITPAQTAAAVPNAGLVLILWALGGIIALSGALTFSELSGLFPRSGGVYVYLKEAFGPLAGFLYGWAILLIINTGALAGLCVAFADYLKIFFPDMTETSKTVLAAGTLLSLTFVNMFGVSISQRLAKIFGGMKLAVFAVLVLAGLFLADSSRVPVDFSLAQNLPPNLPVAMLTGLIGVFFSFGGWHHASYMAGEAIEPRRTVPRAMLLGVGIVTVAYLLVNLAYLRLLPIADMAHTKTLAGDAVATLVPWGGRAVAVAIAISVFGTISIYTMSAPRIYYAMAQDGIFFRKLAEVHPRWRTPVFAMLFQVAWALVVLLFFRGVFEQIVTFITFVDCIFLALAGAAVFYFRKKMPSAERPIRAWGYPLVPLFFILIEVAFSVNTLRERPEQAWPGLAVMAVGVAAYFWFRKKNEVAGVG